MLNLPFTIIALLSIPSASAELDAPINSESELYIRACKIEMVEKLGQLKFHQSVVRKASQRDFAKIKQEMTKAIKSFAAIRELADEKLSARTRNIIKKNIQLIQLARKQGSKWSTSLQKAAYPAYNKELNLSAAKDFGVKPIIKAPNRFGDRVTVYPLSRQKQEELDYYIEESVGLHVNINTRAWPIIIKYSRYFHSLDNKKNAYRINLEYGPVTKEQKGVLKSMPKSIEALATVASTNNKKAGFHFLDRNVNNSVQAIQRHNIDRIVQRCKKFL